MRQFIKTNKLKIAVCQFGFYLFFIFCAVYNSFVSFVISLSSSSHNLYMCNDDFRLFICLAFACFSWLVG